MMAVLRAPDTSRHFNLVTSQSIWRRCLKRRSNPRIAAAVGVCYAPGRSGDQARDKQLQAAVSKAIEDAVAAGADVQDTPAMRTVMADARAKFEAENGPHVSRTVAAGDTA
jgi:hypothetical protein